MKSGADKQKTQKGLAGFLKQSNAQEEDTTRDNLTEDSVLGKRKADGRLKKNATLVEQLPDVNPKPHEETKIEAQRQQSNDSDAYEGEADDGQVKGQTTLTGFLKTSHGQPLLCSSKYRRKKKHPLSLWRDETLVPRQLEGDETIFDIIMPWVAEEMNALSTQKKKNKGGGGRQNKDIKKTHQSSLSTFFGASSDKSTPAGNASANSPQQAEETPKQDEFDQSEQLAMLSKVVKVPNVTGFEWKYIDYNKRVTELSDVQCILINPRWADHGKQVYGQDKALKTEDKSGKQDRRKAFSGITIDDFKKLVVPTKVMKDGILFIWAEKELIGDIVLHFENQGFQYVENMVYVMLDPDQKKSVNDFKNTDATPAIAREPYQYIRKSHKTLLMLRRTHEKKCDNMTKTKQYNNLELRHQRTGDVVFDWIDPSNPFKKPEYYVYKLIEILLPKAMNKLPEANTTAKNLEEMKAIKMVELWPSNDAPRKGWLKVASLSGD